MADNLEHPYNRLGRVLTIDDLPDDALLAIFDFYVVGYQYPDLRRSQEFGFMGKIEEIESWQSLVHVCRRWRCLVFGSPRRLDLQLYCRTRTLARRSLDVWPALPLFIEGRVNMIWVDDVIASLEHSDRIRQIDLDSSCQTASQSLWTAMQVPFPELTRLCLAGSSLDGPVLPDSFLGGSAPRLRYLLLNFIPFPGLLKLLLYATHLVELCLHNIPSSGYISPEAMATCLSVLTNLETLRLHPLWSYPDLKSRRSFPQTRSVLPALTNFWFIGPNGYLEEFVARIDAPQLSSTTFSSDIDFRIDTPGLIQFISRAPTFGTYNEAYLIFDSPTFRVRLRQSHPGPSDHRMVEVKTLGSGSRFDRRLSTMVKICTLPLRPLLTMENLYIMSSSTLRVLEGAIANTKWLELLLPFTAVKNLYISKLISPHIALALQELTGETTTGVLPALKNILLEEFQPSEPVQEGIAQFISARQLANHPVVISVWDKDLVWHQMQEVDHF